MRTASWACAFAGGHASDSKAPSAKRQAARVDHGTTDHGTTAPAPRASRALRSAPCALKSISNAECSIGLGLASFPTQSVCCPVWQTIARLGRANAVPKREARSARREARGAGREARGAGRETTRPRDHETTGPRTTGLRVPLGAWRCPTLGQYCGVQGAGREARGGRRETTGPRTTVPRTTDHGPRYHGPRTTDHGLRVPLGTWCLALVAARAARAPWSRGP